MYCQRPPRYDSNHVSTVPLKPYDTPRRHRSVTWSTVSKATDRSATQGYRSPLHTRCQPVLPGLPSPSNDQLGRHSVALATALTTTSCSVSTAHKHVDETPQLPRSRAFSINFLLREFVTFLLRQKVPVLTTPCCPHNISCCIAKRLLDQFEV